MSAAPPPTDVVLVGLGGAGGIAAHVLTEAGLEVVALEAGRRLDAGLMALDEIRNDVRDWMAEPKARHELPTFRQGAAAATVPAPWPTLMVNAVGGSTVHYPGLSIRFQPWNFRSRQAVLERYGADAIPEGSTLADWPLGYDELEQFYEAVEHAIGVSGTAGNAAGDARNGGNPYEAPRRGGYPMAAVRRSGWNELTAAAARELGWHPFPAPAAVNAESYNGNPECTYCGFCSSNGCYRDAKGSTDANVIRWAEATGRLRIETGARAVRIESDEGCRVTGVAYVQAGHDRFQPARAALVGAFTYENTRLLLLSAATAFPRGLANNHGQVGKHFTAHVTPVAYGLFPGKQLNLFNGFWAQATCVEDWNADNFDHTGLGFVGGAMLAAPQEAKPIAVAGAPVPPAVPRWGSQWKSWLAAHAQSIGSVTAQFDSLTYETNVLELDPAVTDPHGHPVVRITHELYENERRGHAFMLDRLHTWLRAAGATETWSPEGLFVEGRHCYGGTRMGDDPATSVVDRYGFAHESPNLGLLGASTFPTAGGSNPTLTVQALAWRTARHLADNWSAIAEGA